MKKVLYIGLIFLLAGTFQLAQDLDKKIQNNTERLEKIRAEINNYKNQLQEVRSEEKTLYSEVQSLEERINLNQKKIRQVKIELKQTEFQINRTTRNINNLEKRLNYLKKQYAEVLVYLYKKGEYETLELMLTSQSLNQAIYRYKYLHTFHNSEQELSKEIKQNMNKLVVQKRKKIREMNERDRLLAEMEDYQDTIEKQKKTHERKLAQARQDKKSLMASIKEKEKAVKQLEELLASQKKERKERQEQLARMRAKEGIIGTELFQKSKGKLSWPAYGEIINGFGEHRNPELNTITSNPGIDIKAGKDSPVRVVHDGMVSAISYIRGFGNIIIVDHGAEYYTVYAHVTNIRVFKGDYVSRNMTIAKVGQSGSLRDDILHFEIWHKDSKLNPVRWLGKSA
ncbi:MAG: peptidoglycan DD-metalloendopeptidase family protein [Candidatus Marinimicrobia bacterium]|nr:peptidoglycan DD-metalloendopeptidase family protein [Candidatus Neomarinimicrobiota bacterium]